jgi:hypothetical protein
MSDMKTEIEKAIKSLTKKAENENESHKAMQFSQSVLNLAHARATLVGANVGSLSSQKYVYEDGEWRQVNASHLEKNK